MDDNGSVSIENENNHSQLKNEIRTHLTVVRLFVLEGRTRETNQEEITQQRHLPTARSTSLPILIEKSISSERIHKIAYSFHF